MSEGGGTVWNTLKVEQKRNEGETDFKKGGCKLGPGVGALKRGGGWDLLKNNDKAASFFLSNLAYRGAWQDRCSTNLKSQLVVSPSDKALCNSILLQLLQRAPS